MDSQLIVVDFSRVKRPIDFRKLTGFTTDTMSYYRDELFDEFSAYLFNYDRWGSRPLFELVFLFNDPVEPIHQGPIKLPSTQKINALVTTLVERYTRWSKSQLAVVAHEPLSTICGFASTEKYPSPGITLSWLVEPIEEKQDAQSSDGKDPNPSEAPA